MSDNSTEFTKRKVSLKTIQWIVGVLAGCGAVFGSLKVFYILPYRVEAVEAVNRLQWEEIHRQRDVHILVKESLTEIKTDLKFLREDVGKLNNKLK